MQGIDGSAPAADDHEVVAPSPLGTWQSLLAVQTNVSFSHVPRLFPGRMGLPCRGFEVLTTVPCVNGLERRSGLLPRKEASGGPPQGAEVTRRACGLLLPLPQTNRQPLGQPEVYDLGTILANTDRAPSGCTGYMWVPACRRPQYA